MVSVLAAARGHDPADHFAWVVTGTEDFAHPFEEHRVDRMRRTESFIESDDERVGNFA